MSPYFRPTITQIAGMTIAFCIPGLLIRTLAADEGAGQHPQDSMNKTGINGGDFGAAALIDDAALAALTADVGMKNLVTVLTAFNDELVRRVPVLQAALDASDLAAIARETHSIKGSALTFGAAALGAAARRANDASRTGDSTTALLAAREVLALMPATREAVARLAMQTTEVQQQ
jgi:HPt (histidine-containing phosphotransfer) domain-containing protein